MIVEHDEEIFPGGRASHDLREEDWSQPDSRSEMRPEVIMNSNYSVQPNKDQRNSRLSRKYADDENKKIQSRHERSKQFVSYIREQMMEEYGFDLIELDERQYAASDLKQQRKINRRDKSGNDYKKQVTDAVRAKKAAMSPLNLQKDKSNSKLRERRKSNKGKPDISAGKIGTLLESHKHLKQFSGAVVGGNSLNQTSNFTNRQLIQAASNKAIMASCDRLPPPPKDNGGKSTSLEREGSKMTGHQTMMAVDPLHTFVSKQMKQQHYSALKQAKSNLTTINA